MGDLGLGQILIAIVIGVVVWRVSMTVLRMLATPPPEVDPLDVVEVEHQDFRCSVCGTEVTLRVANVTEMSAPKHCREEMDPVWRAQPT